MSWPWTKVISPRSRSQCTHTQNSRPGHNSSLPSWIWIIFHTIVVHDPRVCHDLEPRSYLKGQGHSAHIPKICAWAITPHCQVGSWYYFTQLLFITQRCVLTLNQGWCSRVFFSRSQKWWRKLNRIVTSSALLQNGTYIWILVSIERQFQVVYIDMKHDWKKATLIPAVAAKDRDASNLTRHFHLGLPSSQGGTTPKLKDFDNNFYMNWQRTYCY